VDNELKGTITEQYEINGRRVHLLTDLANKIDERLSKELGFHRNKNWFEKFDNLFVQARYPYEEKSRIDYSEVPIAIGIELLNNTIEWYKESGSNDPWI
jgi:HEPN domain-containing protein